MTLRLSSFLSLIRPFTLLVARDYHQLMVLKLKRKTNLEKFSPIFPKVYQFSTVKCWQCGIQRKNITELFCKECNFIQNPNENENFFKLFGLDENFELDLKDLTAKYRKMQNLLHPDRFTNKSSEEKGISADYSSLVNKAYATLQSPLSRAVHLLNLKGEIIDENQKIEDPSFLMEIMELNEQVEDANTDEKLLNLNEENKKELAKIAKSISQAFLDNKISDAKTNIVKMKYFTSISKHINGLLREKGINE